MFENQTLFLQNNTIGPLLSIFYDKAQIKYFQNHVLNKSIIQTSAIRNYNPNTYYLPYPINFFSSLIKEEEINKMLVFDPTAYTLYKIYTINNMTNKLEDLHRSFIDNLNSNGSDILMNNTKLNTLYYNLTNSINKFVDENSEFKLYNSTNMFDNPILQKQLMQSKNLTQKLINEFRTNLKNQLNNVTEKLAKIQFTFWCNSY